MEARAPLSGTVVAANEALREHPGLVNDDPFERGWAVKIKADKPQKDAAPLLRGSQGRSWFRQEIDRLLTTVLGHPTLQPALPDGARCRWIVLGDRRRDVAEANGNVLLKRGLRLECISRLARR